MTHEAKLLIAWFAEEDGFKNGTKSPHKWVLQAESELRRQDEAITKIQDQRTQELRAYELAVSNLRAKVDELEARLVAEAARTAEEKLRADQMSQQHSTQAALNSEARKELAEIKLAATQPAAQRLDPDSVVRHLAIGRAIERVCVELPEGAEISISLEKGAGTITLIDLDGNEQENFPTDDGFAGTLNAAVDTAIADEAAIAAQAKQGGAV